MNVLLPYQGPLAGSTAVGATPQDSSANAAVPGVALKEWVVVCDVLLAGRQVVLLRKGGIHEPRRGFAIEHEAFFLYPNAEHQRAEHLQTQYHPWLVPDVASPRETGAVVLPGFARVTDVIPATDPDRLRALERETCWTSGLFDLRLSYKPERPLYVVVVRAYRLLQPVTLPYHKLYAGCRSWVPLRETIPPEALAGAQPALEDAAFEQRRQAVRQTVQ